MEEPGWATALADLIGWWPCVHSVSGVRHLGRPHDATQDECVWGQSALVSGGLGSGISRL